MLMIAVSFIFAAWYWVLMYKQAVRHNFKNKIG